MIPFVANIIFFSWGDFHGLFSVLFSAWKAERTLSWVFFHSSEVRLKKPFAQGKGHTKKVKTEITGYFVPVFWCSLSEYGEHFHFSCLIPALNWNFKDVEIFRFLRTFT